MCSFNIGLFSLFIATASLSSASYFDVKCDFGVAYYATNTSVLVNGSLTSNFSHARNCHVMYNKSESALIRVAVGRLNASSNLRALYSMIIENVTVLFVGVAHLHDLANSSKYYFHACPQGHTQQDLDILFFGSPEKEAIDVKIELDPSVLTPGEPANLSVKPNGLANVTAFDIENEHNLTSLIQILVSSNDDKVECLLMVSQSCSSMQSQGLAEKRIDNTQSSIKLTFTKSGAITLSQYSKPKIATGRWYIGISCKSTVQETTLPKNVAVTVKKGYTYDMLGKTLPIAFMCIIAVIGGISIAVFAHFFLNPDFGECSFSCHDHLEVTQNRNRSPSTEMSDCCREPLPRGTFLFKEWFKVIFLAWFGQGIKTYSYLTAVLAISFMVGSAQFVIARWSSMIEDGNRDLCYYNELCYRPIAIADMPSNFMLSNVPYIIHGVLLALSFSFREAIKQEACSRSSRRYSVESARLTLLAPYDYSVAYALSWALIFEGLFSATYHLCPSRLTFQFDSAFMFIISGLVVVALYNCRVKRIFPSGPEDRTMKHPSETTVQAPKYFLFFVAPLLVFNYIGSVKDTHTELPFSLKVIYWLALVAWFVVMYIWTIQKVGVPCCWERCNCGPDDDCWDMKAIIKWIWITLFPLCLLIIGFKQKDDWSQIFLFSCVAAVVLTILGLISFDIAMDFKRHHQSGENNCYDCMKQLFQPKQIFRMLLRNWHRVLYVIATFLFWVFAMYFFKIKSTTRKVEKPSVSRTKNKECVLWDFFDYHDIWHMLSSFALFMSAYLLIYVTRKVEIYFWHCDDNPQAERGVARQEEQVHPCNVTGIIPCSGKPRNGEIAMGTLRYANNIKYARVSYV